MKYYISKGNALSAIEDKDELPFKLGSALAGVKQTEITEQHYKNMLAKNKKDMRSAEMNKGLYNVR